MPEFTDAEKVYIRKAIEKGWRPKPWMARKWAVGYRIRDLRLIAILAGPKVTEAIERYANACEEEGVMTEEEGYERVVAKCCEEVFEVEGNPIMYPTRVLGYSERSPYPYLTAYEDDPHGLMERIRIAADMDLEKERESREEALSELLKYRTQRRGITMKKLARLYTSASECERMVVTESVETTRYQSKSHPGGKWSRVWLAYIYEGEALIEHHKIGRGKWRVIDLLDHCVRRLKELE